MWRGYRRCKSSYEERSDFLAAMGFEEIPYESIVNIANVFKFKRKISPAVGPPKSPEEEKLDIQLQAIQVLYTLSEFMGYRATHKSIFILFQLLGVG